MSTRTVRVAVAVALVFLTAACSTVTGEAVRDPLVPASTTSATSATSATDSSESTADSSPGPTPSSSAPVSAPNSSGSAAASSSPAAPADLVLDLASIPAATFDAVGTGDGVTAVKAVSGTPAHTQGLPRVVFFGAEFCPYCYPNAWGLVVALDRFGTFTGLGLSRSSTTDISPNTAGFTFHGAKYQSQYLSFTGYEVESNTLDSSGGYAMLDTPSTADADLLKTRGQSAFPYLNFGLRYETSTSFTPDLLAGLDQRQIVDRLKDAADPVTVAIIGTANFYAAAICRLTGGRPTAVCSSAGVRAGTAKLGSG